jgi:hypothetical protein
VAIQAQLLVVGAVAVAAVVAVVVGPAMADGAVDGEDVVGSVLDVASVVAAVRADSAGAYIPPFFRSSRPVC